MNYWLIKSEPSAYSWQQLVKDKRTGWSGVRNYQAANFLKSMRLGDRCFFYHSNEGLEIVGIAKVVKETYPDATDPKGVFVMVDIAAEQTLPKPVSLQQIKQHPKLSQLGLVRQGRLSVMPVDKASWKIIGALGGLKSV